MEFVIARHRAGAAFLHRRAGLEWFENAYWGLVEINEVSLTVPSHNTPLRHRVAGTYIGGKDDHFRRAYNFPRWLPWGSVDLRHPWNKEIVADGFGQIICHELITTVTAKEYMSQDVAENVLFEAPYILFVLMEALDKVAASNNVKGWTHPPANLRKSKLLSLQIAQGLHKDYQEIAEARSTHVGLLTRDEEPAQRTPRP
ncbi:MAG: hypothetical protein WBE80_04440 [Methylocella sp.]